MENFLFYFIDHFFRDTVTNYKGTICLLTKIKISYQASSLIIKVFSARHDELHDQGQGDREEVQVYPDQISHGCEKEIVLFYLVGVRLFVTKSCEPTPEQFPPSVRLSLFCRIS